MKAVRYVGPFTDGVEINETGQVVLPGESVDVGDELALSLCEQAGNWEPDGWELPVEAELDEEPETPARPAQPPAQPPALDEPETADQPSPPLAPDESSPSSTSDTSTDPDPAPADTEEN